MLQVVPQGRTKSHLRSGVDKRAAFFSCVDPFRCEKIITISGQHRNQKQWLPNPRIVWLNSEDLNDEEELRQDSAMTMTMTHSKKSHIHRMKAWPYRQECRDHGPTKKNLFYW